MRTTRFDLEQAIFRCWSTSDDIDVLMKAYMDRPNALTEDEMANALLGIKTLNHLRAQDAMEILEKLTTERAFKDEREND
jgi:predicted DNA-binding transcriptional regulator YafY